MKKTLCLFFCLCLLLAVPVWSAEETGLCGDGLMWTVADGTLTISGYGDMYWYDMGSAPWYSLRESIRSVSVEEGVTGLSYCSFFYLTELTEVSLPATLQRIGGMAFYGCRSLPEVDIPAAVRSIGESAFYGCRSLAAIHVAPENGTFRDDGGVLYEGTSLLCYPGAKPEARYEIQAGTEKVESCAFSYSLLQTLWIPASVRSIDLTALTDCYYLASVEVEWGNWYYAAPDGVLYTGDMGTLICYPAQKQISSYRVPAGVRDIAIRAFACNTYLRRVDILGDLGSLGSLAFLNCTALRRIYFHGSAPETVGFNPFTPEISVYYIEGKEGWSGADVTDWNLKQLLPWTDNRSLLACRGRLTQ
ncbi:MAG: leucine-rich repeat domain-containing protein [Oscillospiraceae bacterium]|nr:leucine-rich repeat domain-containing protein [Oscillospiraceae bacterium]